jgi:hypothetical protein
MFLKRAILYAAILLLAGVLGTNVYTSVVDAPNWGASIPSSLDAAKNYFTVTNPGTFFRIFSPAAQVAALLSVILCWKYGWLVRGLTIAALVLAVVGDVMTFAYFYPRNEIMFGSAQHPNEVLQNAWTSWSAMNHLRSAVILAAALSELAALSVFERMSADR